jgi:transposase
MRKRLVQRWSWTYTAAGLGGLKGLLPAARPKDRGYCNTGTFITIIYLFRSPAASIPRSA